MVKLASSEFQITIDDLPVIAGGGAFVEHVLEHNLGTDKIQVITNSNNASTGVGIEVYGDVYQETNNLGLLTRLPTPTQVTLRFYRFHGVIADIRVVVRSNE